jgi:D-hydroxyproline dehydrogenase subunit beta
MSYDVVIVGAGIVGCACARECAAAKLRTAIVEQDFPGGAATAAGMGHIVVMDDSAAQLSLTRFAQTLWQELQLDLPAAVEYEARGTIWIAAAPDEQETLDGKKATYAGAGISSYVLDTGQLAEAEPSLRKHLHGGLLVPEDAVIYPPAAASFFLRQAAGNSAVLFKGQPAIRVEDGTVQLADGTRLSCGTTILATGIDLSLLPWLPLQKRKGHLLITDRYPGSIRHQLLELGYSKSAHATKVDSVAFNVQPRRTGQLLIGSSRQYGAESWAIEPAILSTMLMRARSFIPGLAETQAIRTWTGFRAATPDNLPLLGPVGDSRLQLAMGFEGLGITIAPAAARLVLDQILQRTSAISIEPYLATRESLTHLHHG